MHTSTLMIQHLNAKRLQSWVHIDTIIVLYLEIRYPSSLIWFYSIRLISPTKLLQHNSELIQTFFLSNRLPVLWRGMRNMKATDLLIKEGGTEMAFMSTTTNVNVAVRYSLR
jgi:hypothetical protein